MSQKASRPRRPKGSSYSERKITQLGELKNIVMGLDLDEGIRFVVDVPGYEGKAFVFATKGDDKICIVTKERVFDKNINQYVPGGKEQWKYFETPDEAWDYVSKLLKPPIEAYYY